MRMLPASDPDLVVLEIRIPRGDVRDAAIESMTVLEQLCLAQADVARPAQERVDCNAREDAPHIPERVNSAIAEACELLAFRRSGSRREPTGLVALVSRLDGSRKNYRIDYVDPRHGEGLLTTRQAAERLRTNDRQIRRMAERGELRAKRVGNAWLIRADALPGESSGGSSDQAF